MSEPIDGSRKPTRSQWLQIWILVACGAALSTWFMWRWNAVNNQSYQEDLAQTGRTIQVEIEGDIPHPGIFELPLGSTVGDLLERAGAPERSTAVPAAWKDLPLLTGMKLQTWKSEQGAPVFALNRMKADSMGLLLIQMDLNAADQQDLESLPGIGPETARAIIADRLANGPYQRIDDLDRVKGIGPKTIEGLRFKVVVAQPPASPNSESVP